MTRGAGRENAWPKRVFYASAGNADLIATHRAWAAGELNFDQVSLSFSGQITQYIEEIGAEGLLTSTRADGRHHQDGRFRIEHHAKGWKSGLRFHVEELRYALHLVRRARAFGADVALVDSGVMHFFLLALFPLFGIPVFPILHNALWPEGFPPTGRAKRQLLALDARFWRRGPRAVIAVSPAIERQIRTLSGNVAAPIHQMRAQFHRAYFAVIPAADPAARPFRATFVGRLDEGKGALDIPAMAMHCEAKAPGLIHWTVCGAGPDLERLRADVAAKGLADRIDVRGWTSPAQLQQVYAASHVSVVPTHSIFAEGLAMTAAEATLSNRPLVSNPVVPALELLRGAALAATPDDAISHAEAVLALATDPALYARLVAACPPLAEPFFDRDQGLTAVLHRAVGTAR
jgi:glycosyltransferase involved in cell wall biosynthesis